MEKNRMRDRVILILTTLLSVALAGFLCLSALGIYRAGLAARETDPLAWIYTREKAGEALMRLLPLFLLWAAATAAAAALGVRDRNAERVATVPEAAAQMKKARQHWEKREQDGPEKRRVTIVRAVVLALAVLLVAAGFLDGSIRDVLVKAVNLCAECIGLG